MFTVLATPAVTGEGNPKTAKADTAAALIWIPLCVAVSELVAVSVAVSDCAPAVFRVAVNVWIPLSHGLGVQLVPAVKW